MRARCKFDQMLLHRWLSHMHVNEVYRLQFLPVETSGILTTTNFNQSVSLTAGVAQIIDFPVCFSINPSYICELALLQHGVQLGQTLAPRRFSACRS